MSHFNEAGAINAGKRMLNAAFLAALSRLQ